MSAQNTPGPWSACEHSWSRIGIYSARHPIAALDIADDATEETQDEWMAVMAANARLIAAAPDLLEALIAIVNSPGGCSFCDSGKPRKSVRTGEPCEHDKRCGFELARAAIAKATGAQS